MYFQQFYLTCLAQASYLIADEGSGDAVVVDPQRDVDLYLEEAAAHGFAIRHVIETHLHADFVSGHRELAARTGARIYLGAAVEAGFEHVAVREGDEIRLGPIVLRFLETPGHTPESVCVTLTDPAKSTQPWSVLTGDTLFIGDVGRPDLSPTLTPQQLAGMLYDSLHQKLLTLPEDTLVYPAHGAGSLCGKNLSSERSSTIGQQRQFNYALQPMTREAFIAMMTADLPERPQYFAQDAEINRQGPALLNEIPLPGALSPQDVAVRVREGAVALDTRPAALFGAGHVPGAINIGLGGQYATWAATVIGLGKPIVIIAEDDRVHESTLRLARVGIESVVGYLEGGMAAWEKAGLPLEEVPQVSVHQLREHAAEWQVLDVRRPGEWKAGRLDFATLLPLDQLGKSLPPFDRNAPLAVHCKSGYRSSIAAGILQRHGFRKVMNVVGGFDAWVGLGFQVSSSKFHVETGKPGA
jgi:glyoxylase-like metal-dependent hydrolase (beta-lactamase superfamily II)/rhodanese-related sulfurtransferase